MLRASGGLRIAKPDAVAGFVFTSLKSRFQTAFGKRIEEGLGTEVSEKGWFQYLSACCAAFLAAVLAG